VIQIRRLWKQLVGFGRIEMPNVTQYSDEVQVFIVAGGRGTRSLNPQSAKVLQEISPGINLIKIHLTQLEKSSLKQVTFLLSNFSAEVISYLEEIKPEFPGLDIDWILDTSEDGTLGALVHAVNEKPSERYLVILGDIVISANYKFLLERWLRSKTAGAIVVHPNLHPIESDKVLSDRFDKVTRIVIKNDTNFVPDQPIRSAAGLFFFSHECFVNLQKETGDIVSDFLQFLCKKQSLLALNSSYFYHDTGTPERLNRVARLYDLGAFKRRSEVLRRSIFLDRDGTLIPNIGTNRKQVSSFELETNSLHAIARANDFGIPVFVVTNQPGIAKGEIDFCDVNRVQMQIEFAAAKVSAMIDDFRFCPHHPDKGFNGEIRMYKGECDCRKPKISLFMDLARQHSLLLQNATMIGDSESDRMAAETAGMSFVGLQNYKDLPKQMNLVIDAILDAD